MIKTHPPTLAVLLAAALLAGCSATKPAAGTNGIPSLKETFKTDFTIGTALNTAQIEERDTGAARLVPQQFNTATP